jgi:DNA-binding LacI/PurR family transcriptional regulator
MARTLEEMAQILGISRRSISRFLQGKGYLSKGNREVISAFLRKEAYYPNVLGARLAAHHVPVLGVVFPRFEQQDGGFYVFSILKGIWQAAQKAGMQVMQFSQSPFQEEESLRIVKSKLAGGLLFVSPNEGDRPLFRTLKREGIACVVLSATIPGVESFVSDNRGGAREAVRHLIRQGNKRIAFLHGKAGWSEAEDRFVGYREALREGGLRFDPKGVQYGYFSIEGGEESTDRLLGGTFRPDAVFAANDLMAIGAVRAIRKRGLQIPGDVCLIGYDDIPFCGLSILEPTLSSMAQPFGPMAEDAAACLVGLIQKKSLKRGGAVHSYAPELVVRGSSLRVSKS